MSSDSTQTAPLTPAPTARQPERPFAIGDWLPYAVIGLLLIAIYYRIGIKLVHDWYTIPDYSHGFLVPLFSAFLIWDRRKIIRATPVRSV